MFYSSLIKGAAIAILCIEWYVGIFGDPNHCEAMPQFVESESIYPRKVSQISADSSIVSMIGFFGHNKATVSDFFDKSVQFRLKGTNQYFPLFFSVTDFFSRVGEKVVEIYRYEYKKYGGNGELSENDILFYHKILCLIIAPMIAVIVSILYTKRR